VFGRDVHDNEFGRGEAGTLIELGNWLSIQRVMKFDGTIAQWRINSFDSYLLGIDLVQVLQHQRRRRKF